MTSTEWEVLDTITTPSFDDWVVIDPYTMDLVNDIYLANGYCDTDMNMLD